MQWYDDTYKPVHNIVNLSSIMMDMHKYNVKVIVTEHNFKLNSL